MINQNFSTYGLISFSGETKANNKLNLVTLGNKLKINTKKDTYRKNLSFRLGKVHMDTSFSVARDNI